MSGLPSESEAKSLSPKGDMALMPEGNHLTGEKGGLSLHLEGGQGPWALEATARRRAGRMDGPQSCSCSGSLVAQPLRQPGLPQVTASSEGQPNPVRGPCGRKGRAQRSSATLRLALREAQVQEPRKNKHGL